MSDLQPRIVILIGAPASGKSTWCDKFLDGVDDEYVVVSSDNEIERLCTEEGITYSEGFDRFIGKATNIMKQSFSEAVNTNRNIIWDQTNLTIKKRRGILQKLPDYYIREAVAFEVTLDDLNNRLSKREAETGKHIPKHVVLSMCKNYTPPTVQEGFDKVTIIK